MRGHIVVVHQKAVVAESLTTRTAKNALRTFLFEYIFSSCIWACELYKSGAVEPLFPPMPCSSSCCPRMQKRCWIFSARLVCMWPEPLGSKGVESGRVAMDSRALRRRLAKDCEHCGTKGAERNHGLRFWVVQIHWWGHQRTT